MRVDANAVLRTVVMDPVIAELIVLSDPHEELETEVTGTEEEVFMSPLPPLDMAQSMRRYSLINIDFKFVNILNSCLIREVVQVL